jgi:hypothetical protein
MTEKEIITTLATIGVLTTLFFPVPLVLADSINPGVYSVDEKPFGSTYSQWTENFWKWMVSIPQENNPNLDSTGEKCAINQSDPNVWYLVPTFGGSAERTCNIPEGKAILFCILCGECSYAENQELKSESELRTCARQSNDVGPRSMQAVVDGNNLKDLEKYRVESSLFDLSLPQNNVYSAPPGKTKSVSDGFWVFLEPMPVGAHDIEFSGSLIDPSGVGNYNTHVKYNLIVGK